jgi:uncharacterized protein YbjT (DUF2867 family)
MTIINAVRRAFTRTSPILITGATGKTGARVAQLLAEQGHPIRLGSRRADIVFDWNQPDTWTEALDGVKAVYIAYSPDLAVPGAVSTITRFVDTAAKKGVQRLVLLSGRGEAEAQACERIVLNSGLEASVVRASWFNQNFSEGAFVDMVRAGQLTLPAGDTPEPFVDADDIAEVVAAALTQPGHDGEIYEVTGPRLMTFKDVAAALSEATGRTIDFIEIPHAAFLDGVKASGAPSDVVWLMDYLFTTVFDGRNAHVCDGVQRALGRPATEFESYARKTADRGVWLAAEQV